MTPAHRAHALDVEPVAAAELELEPPESRRGRDRPPGHVVWVAEPDRPRRRRTAPREPQEPVDGNTEELPLEVVERCVERALRRLLALDRRKSCSDLLERERIVADEVTVPLDERKRGLRRLAVALDGRRLSAAHLPVVTDRHVDDVGPVLGLTADDERLGELEADDLGAHVHASEPTVASEATYAATSAASCPSTSPGGHHAASRGDDRLDLGGRQPAARERRTGAVRSRPRRDTRSSVDANTVSPRVASPAGVVVAAGADGENGCHFARPNVAAATTSSRANGFAGLRIRTRTGPS